MIAKYLKYSMGLLLIVVAGVGSGYGMVRLPSLLKSSYVEGNYAAYFPRGTAKVAIYGTSWCQYCAKTRDYLHQHHVAFSDFDVEKSKQAKMEYDQLHGEGYPIILIGNRRINGFDRKTIESALDEIDKNKSL